MFLTYDRVFPTGAREEELLRIYRPRPGLPFTNALLDSGERRLLWTTFIPQQIDIGVQHPQGKPITPQIWSMHRTKREVRAPDVIERSSYTGWN
jgi:hypothetical protein